MIRILYTIPNFITAGSQLEMVRLIRRLDRDRFEPTVLIARAGGRERELLEGTGAKVVVAPYYFSGGKLRIAWNCIRSGVELRNVRCAVWHSYHYLDDYTEPLVARVAGAQHWIYTKKNMSWGSRGWRIRSRLASRIILRNGRMADEFFGEECFRHKTVLIYAGVDTGEFRPDPAEGKAFRDRAGIPQSAILASCVAQLVPVKGHKVLLAALRAVPALHLALAGDTTDEHYRQELMTIAACDDLRGRVHFLGIMPDVRPLLHASDLFVLPTLNVGRGEAFGVALIEAMSCGLPCVATDTDGPKEILGTTGQHGLLVPAGNVQELARALTALYANGDLRKSLGEAGRARVVSQFSIEEEVRKTQELYLALASNRRSLWRLMM